MVCNTIWWHVDAGSNIRSYSWWYVTPYDSIRKVSNNNTRWCWEDINKFTQSHYSWLFFTHRLSINIREIHSSILQHAEKSRNLEWSDRTKKTENGSKLINQYELLFIIFFFFQPVIVRLQIKFWIYFLQRGFQYFFWFYLLRWYSVANSSSLSHYYAYMAFLCSINLYSLHILKCVC
jgi:hypothetical protein